MTIFLLKLIALASMVLDHTAAVFSEAVAAPLLPTPVVEILHILGRAAFPLYAFMLAEGFRHTRDWRKYALRMFGLALLSQIPYAFTLNGWVAFTEMPWWRRVTDLNILFTLSLGVLLLAFMDTKRFDRLFASWAAAAALAVSGGLFCLSTLYPQGVALFLAAALLAASHFQPRLREFAGQAARFVLFAFPLFWLLRRNIGLPGGASIHFSFDYGIYALILFAALYWAKTPRRSAAVLALWGLWISFWYPLDMVVIAAAAAAVWFYNGQRGRDDHRLFYWAYPAHLFLLWGAMALLA